MQEEQKGEIATLFFFVTKGLYNILLARIFVVEGG